MLLPDPPRGRWDLRWRMLGADFCIRPLFWVSCVLLGIIYYQDPKVGGLAAFCFWIVIAPFSLFAHELGHVLIARYLGSSPRVVLSGLGGQVYGLDHLKRGSRVLVLASGSLGNLLILGIAWIITAYPSLLASLGEEQRQFVGNAAFALMLLNALWCFFNLLPLWPLDGGRIAIEIGNALLGQRGQTAALSLSLLVCVLMTAYTIVWMHVNLTNRFDEHYPVHLIFFCIMALYCYLFWLAAFRALWGEEEDKA